LLKLLAAAQYSTQFASWGQFGQPGKQNCAFAETESVENRQKTVPWPQLLNALGTDLVQGNFIAFRSRLSIMQLAPVTVLLQNQP
jgi:hypothetical protein